MICCLFFSSFSFPPPHEGPVNTDDPCIVFVPKAFSPNNDGINDHFELKYACELQVFSMQVYNRRNQLVYDQREVDLAWDGTFQGKIIPEGHYSWQIAYRNVENKEGKLSGKLTLIR